MEIKKGKTLSQFIDSINEYVDHCNNSTDGYLYIKKYNELLKQPLKKEMFVVCEFDEFQMEIIRNNPKDEGYKKLLDVYKEAEKKVIFEGFKQWKQGYFELKDGLVVLFTGNGVFLGKNGSDSNYIDIEIETLGDLFQATNGQLITKNLEI